MLSKVGIMKKFRFSGRVTPIQNLEMRDLQD